MHRRRVKKASFNILTVLITLFLLLAIIVIGYFIFTYFAIKQSKESGFDETKRVVLEETDIRHIDLIERFQEKEEYHIVFGKNDTNTLLIAFVPKNEKKGKIRTIEGEKTINREKMKAKWKKTCQSCQFVAIKPAILDDQPLWELTYYDESGRYVFDYVSIYDGTPYEKVLLQRKFK